MRTWAARTTLAALPPPNAALATTNINKLNVITVVSTPCGSRSPSPPSDVLLTSPLVASWTEIALPRMTKWVFSASPVVTGTSSCTNTLTATWKTRAVSATMELTTRRRCITPLKFDTTTTTQNVTQPATSGRRDTDRDMFASGPFSCKADVKLEREPHPALSTPSTLLLLQYLAFVFCFSDFLIYVNPLRVCVCNR